MQREGDMSDPEKTQPHEWLRPLEQMPAWCGTLEFEVRSLGEGVHGPSRGNEVGPTYVRFHWRNREVASEESAPERS